MKKCIKSFWGDMPDKENSLDGIYVIEVPDTVKNYKKVISEVFNVIEKLRYYDLTDKEIIENLDEEDLEAYNKLKVWNELPTVEVDLFEAIPNWYDEHQGCSMGSVLDLLVLVYPDWKYDSLCIDNDFDMDFGEWS